MLVDTVGESDKRRNERAYVCGLKKSVYIRKRQLLVAGVEKKNAEKVQK